MAKPLLVSLAALLMPGGCAGTVATSSTSPAAQALMAAAERLLAAGARCAVDCGEVPGDQARRREVSMPICLGIPEPAHALAADMQDERWGVVASLAQQCRYGGTRVVDPDMHDFQRRHQLRKPTNQSPQFRTLGAELVLAL